ncbi:MAG: InlB B-repeat-containing protein [Clostridia bacterium]|nr:InlB B-repeat-containing protein [Clostridia bacterium]
MKKLTLCLLALVLLLGLVFMTSCGETPAKNEAVVTLSVNGETTTVKVPVGQNYEYTGRTAWEDEDASYVITGWDKPFGMITEDTVFTANVDITYKTVYRIRWQLQNETIITEVPKGQTPVPPEVAMVVDAPEAVYTFTGTWDKTFVPATEEVLYRANYLKNAKKYNVIFKVNGEFIASLPVEYGKTAVAPTVTLPAGYYAISWGPLPTVTGDTVIEGTYVYIDPAISEEAVAKLASGSAAERASTALFLSIHEAEHPGIYTDNILTYLRWLIAGGNEPTFDFSPNFYQPQCAGAVAVAKTIPTLWEKLTAGEVEKLDTIMKCMAVHAALATDDSNSYTTGPGWNGNYNKNWNPNYPISNVTQIIFSTHYFGGAEATNQILKDFDYDTYIAKFKEWGWKNALASWGDDIDEVAGVVNYVIATEAENASCKNVKATGKILDDDGHGHYKLEVTTSLEDIAAQEYGNLATGFVEGQKRTIDYTSARAMMMEGGPVYTLKALYRVSQYCGKPGGTGLGVPAIGEKGYAYKGYKLTDLQGLWNSLLTYNYSGGVCTSKAVYKNGVYLCYIADNTTTPTEGLDGMMKEFNSGDRSSVGYCSHDFVMVQATTAGMIALGLYDQNSEANLKIMKKMWVGNTDFIYKAVHGYASYSGTVVRGAPKIEYANNTQVKVWRYDWEQNGAKRFTIEDCKAPILSENLYDSESPHFAKSAGSPDFTIDVGRKSAAVAGQLKYWENDFFVSFTLNYTSETLGGVEIRFRSGNSSKTSSAFRGKIAGIAGGLITPVNTLDANPVGASIGDYGWHRITIRMHQGAVANDSAKTVAYTFTMTIYVDGVEKGVYELDPSVYVNKGWLLFEATYDETAENHILYAISPDNPYVQIYKSKVFNNTALHWIFHIGDPVAYAGTEPVVSAPIVYELNGGSFENKVAVECKEEGYEHTYLSNAVPFFTSSDKLLTLVDPVREGFTFDGWYSTVECDGERITQVTTENGAPITVYAKWIAG